MGLGRVGSQRLCLSSMFCFQVGLCVCICLFLLVGLFLLFLGGGIWCLLCLVLSCVCVVCVVRF